MVTSNLLPWKLYAMHYHPLDLKASSLLQVRTKIKIHERDEYSITVCERENNGNIHR